MTSEIQVMLVQRLYMFNQTMYFALYLRVMKILRQTGASIMNKNMYLSQYL